jgi:ketosteroid isomerase-like protein
MSASRVVATLTASLAVVTFVGCSEKPVPSSPPPAPVARACDVWAREVSFAKSVVAHDPKAFAEHVLSGAVFYDTAGGVTRGREAIVGGWTSIIAGEKSAFDWHPTSVYLTSDRHVAVSRGPYWIESKNPDAKVKIYAGTYQSTWVLDTDGVWRVAIDGGIPPAPITDDELQKLKASIPATCVEP